MRCPLTESQKKIIRIWVRNRNGIVYGYRDWFRNETYWTGFVMAKDSQDSMLIKEYGIFLYDSGEIKLISINTREWC